MLVVVGTTVVVNANGSSEVTPTSNFRGIKRCLQIVRRDCRCQSRQEFGLLVTASISSPQKFFVRIYQCRNAGSRPERLSSCAEKSGATMFRKFSH